MIPTLAEGMVLPDSAKQLIRSGALGHLVTLGERGTPQVTCVWVESTAAMIFSPRT